MLHCTGNRCQVLSWASERGGKSQGWQWADSPILSLLLIGQETTACLLDFSESYLLSWKQKLRMGTV